MPGEYQSPEPERKVPIYEIKLPKVDGYAETEDSALCKALKKLKLLSASYLYTAFIVGLQERMLSTGTFHAEGSRIDCCHFNGSKESPEIVDDDNRGIIAHVVTAMERSRSASALVAVYKADQLQHKFMSAFEFKNPDQKKAALVALVKVTPADYK